MAVLALAAAVAPDGLPMSQHKPSVWVVELEYEPYVWVPTNSCGLSRSEGDVELRRVEIERPGRRYRLREYARQEPEQSADESV